jgi:DNA-binding MarR family transcriptional regulator
MVDHEELAEQLRASIGRFVRAARAGADTLTPPHAQALGLLDRKGELSIAALAEYRGVRHQSMSRTVMELEELDFVERRRNPLDGRGFILALTAAGREALDRDRRARRDWMAQALGELLAPEERAQLSALPELLDRLSAFRPGG